MPDFSIIAAVHYNTGGIGCDNGLPWRIPSDLAYFRNVTTSSSLNCVIMGYNTYISLRCCIDTSLPVLKGRMNIVVSKRMFSNASEIGFCYYPEEDMYVVESLESALALLDSPQLQERVHKTFVIGGEHLFYKALAHPSCKELLLTHVLHESETETVFKVKEGLEFNAYFPLCPRLFQRDLQLSSYVTDNLATNDWQKDGEWKIRFAMYRMIKPLDESLLWKCMMQDKRTQIQCLNNQCNELRQRIEYMDQDDEIGYLNLVRRVLQEGKERVDRTNVGTLSIFGPQLTFSLKNNRFPLLTTKLIQFKNVAIELLWFIKGSTDSEELKAQKVNIWNANGSRDFLDKRGLVHREVGDLGPVYGFQWRHFGAEYVDKHTDYSGKGIDQLQECIRMIKEEPESRRILQSAWNPCQLDEMALPPCHVLVQFQVELSSEEEGGSPVLNCKMYQRSADLGLGVPYNIASYALLTYMVAHVTNLLPGKLILTFGDAHVYKTHVDKLNEQLTRIPNSFPTLRFARKVDSIDDFQLEDIILEDYNHYPFLSMPMAV